MSTPNIDITQQGSYPINFQQNLISSVVKNIIKFQILPQGYKH